MKIWKISIGEAATSAASQMRRPASRAVAHTVASHASASPNAAMLKNITTSATIGTATSLRQRGVGLRQRHRHVLVDAGEHRILHVPHGGLPSYCVCGLPSLSVSIQLDLYGNLPRFNSSAVYSGTVSE